jgi:hypothetical protein
MRGTRSRAEGVLEKIREALTPPASHRLRPTPPVPTAYQPFSGVTPEVHLTGVRRPRVRAFESATLAGELAPPMLFVPHAMHMRNPETSFALILDSVDYLAGRPGGVRRPPHSSGGRGAPALTQGNCRWRLDRTKVRRRPLRKFERRSPRRRVTVFGSHRRCLPPVSCSPELPPKYA